MSAPIPWPRSVEPATWPTVAPQPVPETYVALLGEYRDAAQRLSVFERDAQLWVAPHFQEAWPLADAINRRFIVLERGIGHHAAVVCVDGCIYHWQDLPGDPGAQLRVAPLRPVHEVLLAARDERPPVESGDFAPSEMVDLATLDPELRFDLRYGSANNFLGYPFYSTPRALLQRPIAEALIAAHRTLRSQGFGLLVWDAYRPWHVSKAFWEATPPESRWIVADPARGSRHNRGAAVDVSLVSIESGRLAGMPSTFDEPTPRACAFYPGGSSLQRWHRDLLRRTMEAEGFTVNDYEWWHFDHRDWARYPIDNRPIE
jgi:D-alanyl-D-alanine dipeptidase